jgi:hypothetical protein
MNPDIQFKRSGYLQRFARFSPIAQPGRYSHSILVNCRNMLIKRSFCDPQRANTVKLTVKMYRLATIDRER